jgi:hypothetical protein
MTSTAILAGCVWLAFCFLCDFLCGWPLTDAGSKARPAGRP